MTNLFSVFSPDSWAGVPANWCALVLILGLPSSFWARKSDSVLFLSLILRAVGREISVVFGTLSVPGSSWAISSLMAVIGASGALGLFPYVFTATSHMSITLGLAVPLWVGHLVRSSLVQPELMWAHLVPLGTPPALLSFMVIIEFLSSLIRPVTLSVRLAANMIAGHLLFSLLSSQALVTNFPVLAASVSALMLLSALEIGVALIQAYVFGLLSSLYVQEVLTPQIL